MVTFYGVLAGLGGGIIAIVSAIGLPFIRKIIFKLFESKVDERANKAISDHNAKNDTKIHVSKALFDKEQKALQNILTNLGLIISSFVRIHSMAHMDNEKKKYTKKDYCISLKYLSLDTHYSIRKSIEDLVYIMNEEIDDKFVKIHDKCYRVHTEITFLIEKENILELKNYLYNMLEELENDYKIIRQDIRKHYNNITII